MYEIKYEFVLLILLWLRTEQLRISAPFCFTSSRTKYSEWCTCGLCVEIRRSSILMLLGDYLTSPPLAPNRSSKTLWYSQNILTQEENIMYLNRSWSWLGGKREGRHVVMKDRQVGACPLFKTKTFRKQKCWTLGASLSLFYYTGYRSSHCIFLMQFLSLTLEGGRLSTTVICCAVCNACVVVQFFESVPSSCSWLEGINEVNLGFCSFIMDITKDLPHSSFPFLSIPSYSLFLSEAVSWPISALLGPCLYDNHPV